MYLQKLVDYVTLTVSRKSIIQGYLFSYINEKSQTADVPIENRMRCREADFRSLPEMEGVW